jgi:hypothetical protein
VIVLFTLTALQVASEPEGFLDVPGPGAFLAAGQQDHELLSLLLVIHPTSRAVINSHLRNPFADGLNVARVSGRQTLDTY